MKIFAVGMNYAEHNKELNNTLLITERFHAAESRDQACLGYAEARERSDEIQHYERKTEEPVIFTKADSALLKNGKPFFVPDFMGRIDHEAELVVRICRLGKGIPERFAHRYYDAVTVGVDFTAREVQKKAKDLGRPWTIAKGFDGSAVIGEWVELAQPSQGDGVGDVQRLNFHLDINGNTVQRGFSGDMLYRVDELIAYISRYFTLKTGDLLYTGTPVGVGPVHVGDHVEGYLEERKVLDFWCR